MGIRVGCKVEVIYDGDYKLGLREKSLLGLVGTVTNVDEVRGLARVKLDSGKSYPLNLQDLGQLQTSE